MASVAAKKIRGVRMVRRGLVDADSMLPATTAAGPAGDPGRKTKDPIEVTTEALVCAVNYSVASPRILLITDGNVFSPRPPEPSTPKAATESADALFAIDTDVVLAKGNVVDDSRDSGAGKLRPGVFYQHPRSRFTDLVQRRRFGN
jgi:hypothetical protein